MKNPLAMPIHKAEFERAYEEIKEYTNNINFPLEEIDLLEWNRGPFGNEIFSFFYRRFTAYTLGLLDVQDGHRILNIGCGMGSEEKNLVNLYRGVDLLSIDISLNMIRAAVNSKCPSELFLSAAEELPFKSAVFDRIVTREVIEHVASPAMMIQEIGRCLKPEGIAVITTEFEPSFGPSHLYSAFRSKILAPLFGIEIPGPAYKDRAPSINDLRQLLSASNLVLDRVIWDGAMYQFCGSLFWQRLFRSKIVSIARFFSRLENEGSIDRYFCDQIKFVIRKPAEGETSGAKTYSRIGVADKSEEKKTEKQGVKRFRSYLFTYTDRILLFFYNVIMLPLATLLVSYRIILGKPKLYEKLMIDDRLAEYLGPEKI